MFVAISVSMLIRVRVMISSATSPNEIVLGTRDGKNVATAQRALSIELLFMLGWRAMNPSIEELWGMSEPALVGAYADARRRFVERKFERDTQRARLEWMRAKAFVGSSGGVTERKMAVDVSDELARKGQELREMTRDVDLIKAEVDVIAIVIRMRGAHAPADAHPDEDTERDTT
jgi:hypothetical protein